MDDDFDYNDTAPCPTRPQEFLLENLCGKKGQSAGGYSPPAPHSAAMRWKEMNEQNMMLQLEEKHLVKKQNVQTSKEAAREIIRKIPVELLAKEWLSKEDATVDMRAYLVDHVLPTLILGVERLLREVDEKGLSATNRFEPEFNPINFLAQYLMRNNPRFSNFAEASPYVRGLREVSEEIKQELFTFEDNRLARIKAESRRKRLEREKVEQALQEAKQQRHEQLTFLYQHFNMPSDKYKVELALVQNALRSFGEIVEQWPKEQQEAAKLGKPFDQTDETGKALSVDDFVQYLSPFVEHLPMETFDIFIKHMAKCAALYRATAEKESKRIILTNLFLMLDHGGLGLLGRQRLLELLERFWDVYVVNGEFPGTLRNPRRWPVIEVEETDDSMFDAWEEEPDGGLTMSDMYTADTEISKIYQEVHRMATIAAVHDKTAVEKWKIKQLSEKSEGKEDGDTGEETEQEQDESLLNATKSKNRVDLGEDIKVGDDEDKVDDQQSVGTDELKTVDKKEIAEVEENDAAEVEEKEKAGIEEKETAEIEDKEPAEIEEKETAEVEENDMARVEEKETAEVEEKETAEVEEKETAEAEETEIIEEKEEDKTVIEKETAEAEVKAPPGKAETQNINQIIDYATHHTIVSEPGQDDVKEKTDPEKTQLEGLTEVDVSNVEQTTKEQAEQEKEEKEKDELDETLAGKAQNTEDPEKKATPVVQRTQSQLSAFDINTLNMSQFVVLLETFLGNEPNYDYFERLIKFLKDNYSDTEDEKMERMMKGRREVISAKRKLMIDTLFEKWDNDGSGFLEMEDVQEVLFKYKDGQEVDGIKKVNENQILSCRFSAQTALRKASKFNDQRLSKQEFRQLIELVVKEMPGSENFEQLLDFLMNSVERSYAERIRGEARKKWLKQIITAAHFSGTLMDPVYKAVFQALYKVPAHTFCSQNISQGDAETHGGEKRISANIALLEVNKMEPRRGPLLLRYSACTPEDCQYMLGKALFKNMKGVSFQAIETGKPVHVPRVANHGSIYFWNYDRTRDDRDGSLVVVPLKDVKKRVFGTLGIDTLCDPYKKSIFITHEVQFFQGVAKAFSIAYHQVEMRRKLLRVAESALLWMSKRCPHITDIAVYLVEPNQMPDGDPVLRKMMVSDKKSPCIYLTEVVRLERKNNLFRDYLFQCMENSDTVMAEAYGERHTATPLRNLSGKALGVVDISIGEIKKLPQFENKEAQRMLRLLQKASKDIAGESQGIERKRLLEAEKDDSSNVTMLFESYMLAELRENISKLDQMAFAELKSYYQPPKVILEICRAALSIFDAEKAGEGQYEDWPVVKNSINNAFINQIKSYDPTKSTEYVKAERVSRYLKGIPHGEVGKYGSIPALLLYNWVFCVLSLIESTIKMREAEEQLQTLIKASNPVTSD
ncbi:unnamed protein product [Lymnaea stagnalis]|uniref:EF-hand domain-containing protein n=1 Tax=Lymnaea stagnalis TaxID=6523 RepID=A0AAV2IJS5_LYMST